MMITVDAKKLMVIIVCDADRGELEWQYEQEHAHGCHPRASTSHGQQARCEEQDETKSRQPRRFDRFFMTSFFVPMMMMMLPLCEKNCCCSAFGAICRVTIIIGRRKTMKKEG